MSKFLSGLWRPAFVILIFVIILYSVLLTNILGLRPLYVPKEFWDTVQWLVGAYIVGRSLEKCMELYVGTFRDE